MRNAQKIKESENLKLRFRFSEVVYNSLNATSGTEFILITFTP